VPKYVTIVQFDVRSVFPTGWTLKQLTLVLVYQKYYRKH